MGKDFEESIYEAIGGVVFGLIIQYVVLPTLAVFSSPWYVWLLIIVVVGADLVTSIIASFSGGLSFAAVFILIGGAMGDWETAGLGILALMGIIGAAFKK